MPRAAALHHIPLPALPGVLLLGIFCLLPACTARSAAGPLMGGAGLAGYELPALNSEGSDSSNTLLSTRSLRPAPDAEVLERARQAEAERALETIWAIVSTTDSLGAEWEIRFWSESGALTLLSLRRTQKGEGRAALVSQGAFLPRLARNLPSLLGSQPGEVTITLEREETGWSVDLDRSSRDTPPLHIRTLPSVRGGASLQAHRQVLDTAQRAARVMTVPREGTARMDMEVMLEDDRVLGWEPKELASSGDGAGLLASEQGVSVILRTLLPFMRGLGERTVSLVLEGEHRDGEAYPRWYLVKAWTVEPLPPPAEVADIHQEYRTLHEYILVEFQDQSRHYAVLAAGISLEQIAYAVVGGILIKRALVLIEVAAPTIASILARGGKGAVRWFRSLLVRASPKDRELLRQLWMKAEAQGLQSLTATERQQFQALMGRMEELLGNPLSLDAKRQFWSWSRREYFELYNPRLAEILGVEGMANYQVHHLIPLQYAQLFPRLDINGKANLIGLEVSIHQSIHRVWNALGGASGVMKPQDVMQVVSIIRRHYGRWFHKVYDPREAQVLARAEQAALAELAELKALITP